MPTNAIDRSVTALHRSGVAPPVLQPARRGPAPRSTRAVRHVGDGAGHRSAVDLHADRHRVRRDAVDEVHRAVDGVEHPRGCPSRRRRPPSSSPSTGSPGRITASRSRSSRSVSVSTMVTGSVGVLLDRTAPASGAPRRAPNTSARRARTKAAASVASCSATARSGRDRWMVPIAFSVTRLSHHIRPRLSPSGCPAATQSFRKPLRCVARRSCRAEQRSADDRHRFPRCRSDTTAAANAAVSASTSAAAASRAASSTWTPAC